MTSLSRLFPKGLSLRLTGRCALVVVGLYVAVASLYSARFLERVEDGARVARDEQIPLILSQNRNALKIERTASLIRSVYLAHDRRIERQVQLQLQTLTQSFTLDENQLLVDGGRQIAAFVKEIVKQRETVRELQRATPDLLREEKISGADAIAAEAYQQAILTTNRLSDNLSRDAIQLADGLASTIEEAARDVQSGWLFILTLPAVFLVLVLWIVSRHVLRPIAAAVARLNGREQPADRPVFTELRTVAEAVDSFGALSLDLQRTNEMLLVLSDHDGLTGLLNRRAFERKLQEAFDDARRDHENLSILMIDLDNFKSINDTHGHEAGDACLRAVASVLSDFADRTSVVVGRHGGEEFSGFVAGSNSEDVLAMANELRHAVEVLPVETGGGQPIHLTASIGISSLEGRNAEQLGILVGEADIALYQAKRAGRNRVIMREVFKNETGRQGVRYS